MFSRKHTAERTAAQAWEYLSSAMASAGDSAREAGLHAVDVTSAKAAEFGKQGTKLAGKAGLKSPTLTEKASRKGAQLTDKASRKGAELTDKASRRVNAVAEEAWSRANAAANALAGNRPGLPWGLIIGAGLIGVALGWAAATTARAALERQAENEELELTETAVIVTPAPTAYDS